jgi:hypothetical protein
MCHPHNPCTVTNFLALSLMFVVFNNKFIFLVINPGLSFCEKKRISFKKGIYVVRTTTIAKWKISKVRTAIEVLKKKRYKDSFKSAAVCKTAARKVFAIAHTYISS